MKTPIVVIRFLKIWLAPLVGASIISAHFLQEMHRPYLCIPVDLAPPFYLPVISNIEIEGNRYAFDIDLGLSQDLGVLTNILGNIKNKKELRKKELKDVSGKLHPSLEFQIPNMKIKTWKITNLTVSEKSHSYLFSTLFKASEQAKIEILEKKSKIRQGTIGWPFFARFSCYFDFPKRQIILGDNLAALRQSGCVLDSFIKIPFYSEKSGLILKVSTDLGTHRLLLDTGASCSLIKDTLVDRQSADEIYPSIWAYSTSSLSFNGTDLGNWTFRLFPISDSCDAFDGALGIDFFKTRAICLDFHNQVAYIER